MSTSKSGSGNAKESTALMLQAMTKYLPGTVRAVSQELVPTAIEEAKAAAAASPILSRSGLDILRAFGPATVREAANIERINQEAAAARELGIASGAGRELVKKADELQRILDPEYYRGKEEIATNLSELLRASGPGLTEGEREEIRRGMGFVDNTSALDTVANAMRFGAAYRDSLNRLANAIQVAGSTLPVLRSGTPAFTIATTRQVNSPTYLERVPTVTPGLGSTTVMPLANNIMQGSYQVQTRLAMPFPEMLGKYMSAGGQLIGGIAKGVAGI